MLLQPALGENLSRLSNVPFWDGCQRNEPGKTYETTFQRDFKSCASIIKRAAISQPVLAKVEHRDLQHIREFQTEVRRAFSSHPSGPISRIPAWTGLVTNLKMHSDERYLNFSTTQSESFPHLPALPVSTRHRPSPPVVAVQGNRQGDKLPHTTQRVSFVPHEIMPLSKAKTKHLGGAPAITGDRKHSFFSSSYSDDFQYRQCAPPQPTEKQFRSSLAMGDKRKIAENETTHAASFCHAGPHSLVALKERLRVNLGDDRDHKWTTTTADAFTEIKPVWVHVEPIKRTLSSIPRGDTDERRNRERMTATTNRFFFSEENHRQFPVHVDGANIRTKSNIHFGPPSLGGTFYSTTTRENYPQKQQAPARPHFYPPGRVLPHQGTGPAMSTVQSDYTPPNKGRQSFCPEHLYQIKACHVRPPHSECCFTTTHKEAFEPKPISKASLDNPPVQHISHMPF